MVAEWCGSKDVDGEDEEQGGVAAAEDTSSLLRGSWPLESERKSHPGSWIKTLLRLHPRSRRICC